MRTKLFLLVGLLSPASLLAADPIGFQVKRQLHLPSDDGQQGIATDGEFLYVQNTRQLFKYDLKGKLIKAGPKLRLHHGGIVCVNQQIYAAVSGCSPEGASEHYVHRYDTRSLALVTKHNIGRHFTVCAGGISYRKGRFFVAESFFDNDHRDRIVEFNEEFKYVKDYILDFKSPYGIQGLEYLPATDQFQIHSHGRDFYRINARFENRSLRRGKSEFELQDVARLDAKTLVVNHRDAEKVLFIDLEVEDAVDDSDLLTTPDLLRGFNNSELAAARKAIPPHREPPLGLPRPRLVSASGHVYEDRNANGRRDKNEPGLAHVMVSDGSRVARTKDDGSFHFRIRMDETPHYRFVVATRPSGFRPTNSYFLRIPFAEDRTDYSADFGFVRDEASSKREFWFITASDSQFTRIEEMIPTAKDYAQVTSTPRTLTMGKPAFLATAGDLTMNGSQFEWDMYDHIRHSSKIPVYEGFGGHDGNCLNPRCTANYEQRIGPPYYSWDYGGVHFIQIVTETGYLKPSARLRQSDWLEADLKLLPPKTPVIVVSHYPLDASWFDKRKSEGINVIAQIGAHWHVVHAGSRRGVPVLNSAPARGRDWGAYSRTYRWVFVSPNGVRSKLRVAGQYKRLKVVAPGPLAVHGQQPLVVLAYDTARLVKSVTCRWTSPQGEMTTTTLRQRGDWSWHGVFAPNSEGKWQCNLEAIDVTGKSWNRSQTVDVSRAAAKSNVTIRAKDQPPLASADKELPYVLHGKPPRNVSEGPRPPLLPLWVKHTGSVHVLHNSPVTSNGKVYLSVGNPNATAPGAGVLCLDAETGKEIWKAKSPHGDIRGPVSVHRNVVYAITGESWVAAFHAETGRPLWSRPMNSRYQDGRPLAINNTSPVPTRFGLLVSDWQKPQSLLDFATGKELSRLNGDVGYYASFATVLDNVMYTVRRGGGSAIQLPGGNELYQFKETSRSTSAPIVVDGKLIYGGSSGIRVRDASNGNLIWQKGIANAGYQNAVPVVWGDQLLVNGTNLQILDLATGTTLKTVRCGQESDRFVRSRRQALAGSSTPIVVGEHAFFGHDDTSLRAINRAGDVIWEHRLGTPIKTAPAVLGKKLFVHDYAGNLWCFAGKGLRDGESLGNQERGDNTPKKASSSDSKK